MRIIEGDVDLSNLHLTELPDLSDVIVTGDFWCFGNQLTSLAGSPKEVEGCFCCQFNNLTSLKGAPQKVYGSFYCNDNKLTSLVGAPKVVGSFWCNDNSKEFTEKEVRAICKVRGKVTV